MANIRITKRFNFETAHALLGYKGACRNLHGHSYVLEVTVKGHVTHSTGLEDGFVVDFSILKKIVNELIVEVLDHALILQETHSDFLKEALLKSFPKVIFVPFPPTTENFIAWIYDRLKDHMPKGVELCRLMLRETDTSFAELLIEDNK